MPILPSDEPTSAATSAFPFISVLGSTVRGNDPIEYAPVIGFFDAATYGTMPLLPTVTDGSVQPRDITAGAVSVSSLSAHSNQPGKSSFSK